MDWLDFLDEDRKHQYPPTTLGVPRLHPSWVSEYTLCGYKFYLRRIQKKRFTRVSAAVGTGCHKTMERVNYGKLAGQTVTKEEGADVSVAAYDEAIQEAECLDTQGAVDKGRDEAAVGGGSVVSVVSPRIRTPVLVESVRVATFDTEEGPVELAGTIDYATEEKGRLIVRDLKTVRRAKKPDWAHGLGQLSAYGILLQGGGHEWPAGFVVDQLRVAARGWLYEPLATTRTEADYLAFWQRVQGVLRGIKAGVFQPAAEGAWNCSERWCEYWTSCPFVAGRRRQSPGPEGDE